MFNFLSRSNVWTTYLSATVTRKRAIPERLVWTRDRALSTVISMGSNKSRP